MNETSCEHYQKAKQMVRPPFENGETVVYKEVSVVVNRATLQGAHWWIEAVLKGRGSEIDRPLADWANAFKRPS